MLKESPTVSPHVSLSFVPQFWDSLMPALKGSLRPTFPPEFLPLDSPEFRPTDSLLPSDRDQDVLFDVERFQPLLCERLVLPPPPPVLELEPEPQPPLLPFDVLLPPPTLTPRVVPVVSDSPRLTLSLTPQLSPLLFPRLIPCDQPRDEPTLRPFVVL